MAVVEVYTLTGSRPNPTLPLDSWIAFYLYAGENGIIRSWWAGGGWAGAHAHYTASTRRARRPSVG